MLQTSSFSIPSARSRASPSPKSNISPRDEEEQLVGCASSWQRAGQAAPACLEHSITVKACAVCHLQEVTGREDSESYAKRTITEIETCLGFTFHGPGGGSEEAPPEAISTDELEVSRHGPVRHGHLPDQTAVPAWLAGPAHSHASSGGQPFFADMSADRAGLQTLNTQVEAALQSGLNFKDRFTTTSRKRLLLVTADADAEQGGLQLLSCPSTPSQLRGQVQEAVRQCAFNGWQWNALACHQLPLFASCLSAW